MIHMRSQWVLTIKYVARFNERTYVSSYVLKGPTLTDLSVRIVYLNWSNSRQVLFWKWALFVDV